MRKEVVLLILLVLFTCQLPNAFSTLSPYFKKDPYCLTPDTEKPLVGNVDLGNINNFIFDFGGATLVNKNSDTYYLDIPLSGATVRFKAAYNQILYYPKEDNPINDKLRTDLRAVFALFRCTGPEDNTCKIVASNTNNFTPEETNVPISDVPPGSTLPPDYSPKQHYCMTGMDDFCKTYGGGAGCKGCKIVGQKLSCAKDPNCDLGGIEVFRDLFKDVGTFCTEFAKSEQQTSFPCESLCSINGDPDNVDWMLCLRSDREQFLPPDLAKFTTDEGSGNCNYRWQTSKEAGGITVGFGTRDDFGYPFTADNQGERYQLRVAIHAVGSRSMEGVGNPPVFYQIWRKIKNIEVRVPAPPSLPVFASPASRTVRYYETTGTYTSEDISFTLVNSSSFKEIVTGLNASGTNCPSGLKCEIDPNYVGFLVEPNGGKLIIPMKVSFNKGSLPAPFSGNISLSVTYARCLDPENCAIGETSTYDHGNQKTAPIGTSGVVNYKAMLMSQQDFQVEIKTTSTGEEPQECIGKDGIVGLTGNDAYPRINPVHGNGKVLVLDICDEGNPDSVYCMQSEFLVELANKIAEVAKLRIDHDPANDYQEDNYKSFSVYIRDQEFNSGAIGGTLDGIINTNFITGGHVTGLNNEAFGSSSTESDIQAKHDKMISLFSRAKILVNGSQNASAEAGKYDVTISISLSGKEGSAGSSGNYLFPSANTLDSDLHITIDLIGPISTPGLHWFFYDKDFNSDTMGNFSLNNSVGGYVTNVTNRGYLMEYTEGSGATGNYLYNTFAVPMFVKISSVASSPAADTKFTIGGSLGTGNGLQDFDGRDLFSYWTGFASSVPDSNGCTTIVSPGTEPLAYREPDNKLSSGTATEFEFENYKSNLTVNGKMYLETVLYLPTDVDGVLTFTPSSTSSLDCFCKTGQCTKTSASCEFNKQRAPFVAAPAGSDANAVLMNVLNEIKDRNVCVYKEFSGADKPKWILFWNQQKILKELGNNSVAPKGDIRDANICVSRPIIG